MPATIESAVVSGHHAARALVSYSQDEADSVAGVSLDEEAAAMMRFQRAYEANARFS